MAIIHSYFDGRGKGKVKGKSIPDNLVVLSGLTGNVSCWDSLQKEWTNEVNTLLDGLPLSVTDCLCGGGKVKHVKINKRLKALENAVSLINKWTRSGINSLSSCVLMDDYRKACSYRRVNTPEEILVDDIASKILFLNVSDRYEFYFDQNEDFQKHVDRYWRRKPSRRATGPYYLRAVDVLTSIPDTRIPIQCADVYTWVVHTYCNRMHCGSRSSNIPSILDDVLNSPPNSRLWDFDALISSPQAFAGNRILESLTKVPSWAV